MNEADLKNLKDIRVARSPLRDSDHIVILSSETKKPYRARIRDLGKIDISRTVFTGSRSSTGGGLSTTEGDSRYLRRALNLSDLSDVSTAQANLKLKDRSADLDLNSISINGVNIFPNNKPQGLDTDGNVQFNQIDLATKLELDDVNGIINSETFASGFAGTGVRLQEDGGWNLTLDNLTVRQRARFYELLINQIRATNGAIAVTSAGEVSSVTDLGEGSYRIFMVENKFVPFLVDDLLISQRFTGAGTYLVEATVTAVENGSATVTDNSTPRYFDVTIESGSDVPTAGMDFIRWGNTSDPNRQGLLYLTSDDDDAPYMDIIYGVDSHTARNTMATVKGRIGRLDGIIDSDFPTLDGNQANEFGVYVDGGYFNNVEVRGTITVLGGNAETTSGAQSKADSPEADAKSYADTQDNGVLSNAQGYTDSLQADLDAILDDAVANGTTIISGGFIQTNLIDVDNLFAQNVSITATLTMGTDGVIRNSNGDYTINENGFAVREWSGSAFSPIRSYKIVDGSDNNVAAFYSRDNSIGRGIYLSSADEDVFILPGGLDSNTDRRLYLGGLINLIGTNITDFVPTVVLDGGVFRISGTKYGVYNVASESGSSDTMGAIRVNFGGGDSGGSSGDMIVLRASPGDTITIDDGLDNIVTGDGDKILSGAKSVLLVKIGANWTVLSSSTTI